MLAGKEVFYSMVGLIIFTSQLVLGTFISPERSLLVFVLIVIAFVLKQKISEKINHWSISPTEQKKTKRPMFLMGRELIDDGSSEKEEKLYENLKLGVRTKRILFSCLIMILVYFVSYFAYKSYISVALLSFSLIAIINSSYIGHFLFIIIINSVSVFVYTGFHKDFDGVGLAAYAFVIILSFFIYKKIESEKSEWKPIGYKDYFVKSIRTFILLFLIYSLYSLALPEKITFFNKKSVSNKISKLGNKTMKSKKAMSITLPPMNMKIDLNNIDMDLEAGLKRIEKIEKLLEGIPNITPEIQMNLNNIKMEIQDTQSSISSIRMQGNVSAEQAKALWNKLNSLQDKMKKIDMKFQKYHKNIQDSVEKYPSETNSKLLKDLDSKFPSENFSKLTDIAAKLEDKKIEVLEIAKKGMEEKVRFETSNKALAIKRIQNKKKEKKTEKLLGHLERLAKVTLLFSGIFFLLLLLRKNKKLSDSKLDKEVINDLILGVKKIQRKKLSPNEEIIESYNVLKDVMKKIEYDDIEVPPPKILFEHLLNGSKRFEDETWFVTDIFCYCYYGQKEANSQELNIFRKSFLRVIKSL